MKIVVALGGNALQNGGNISPATQIKVCRSTVKKIVELIKKGHEIAIVHGNGPQVGEIILSSEIAHKTDKARLAFPLDVCTAFTQGYIGYHIQCALNNELRMAGIEKKASTIITQVQVDEKDPSFLNPTKPIGSFYTEEEAKMLQKTEGIAVMEDANRGWRRAVASPKPVDIIEKDIITEIFNAGNVVISCGGGIPVIRKEGYTVSAQGVIDKDFASVKLAETLDADLLLILTEVDQVYINFNKPNQKALKKLTVKDIDLYMEQNQFAKGSMMPKVLAAKEFVMSGKCRKAIIASLLSSGQAIDGETGTLITVD